MYMKRVHTHKRTKRNRNYNKTKRGGGLLDIFTGKTEQQLNQNREQSEQQQGLFSRFTGALNKTRQDLNNKYIIQKYKAEQGVKDWREKLKGWMPGFGSTQQPQQPQQSQQSQQPQNHVNIGGSKRIRRKTKKTRNTKRVTRRHRNRRH